MHAVVLTPVVSPSIIHSTEWSKNASADELSY